LNGFNHGTPPLVLANNVMFIPFSTRSLKDCTILLPQNAPGLQVA
jgi:hypothetical protein